MSLSLATALLDAALVVGGGTFTKDVSDIEERAKGFVVGGKVPSLILGGVKLNYGPATAEQVAAWLADNPADFYGSWASDGLVYIDAVDILADEFDAIVLGKERGEKAIWDNANAREIDLSHTYLGDGYVTTLEG